MLSLKSEQRAQAQSNLPCPVLAQSSHSLASCPSELQPRRISYLRNQIPDNLSLVSQKHLRECLSSWAISPQDYFQRLDIHQKPSLLDLAHHVRRKLVGRVVAAPVGFTESKGAAAQRQHRFVVRPRKSQMCIVFMCEYVEVVRAGAFGIGVPSQIGHTIHHCKRAVLARRCSGCSVSSFRRQSGHR